jgi:hypothetical protein
MSVGIRLMAGFCLGFELSPGDGVYLSLYLGIAEVIFFNEDYDDTEE